MNFIGAGEASKMEFVILDYLFVMFLTESALLDMFGHRGFLNLSNNTGTSKKHRFKVFHYDLTLHVPIVMRVVLKSEVIQ